MPQLACNHSAALAALLREGAADVDWIKLSRHEVYAQEFAEARPLRPVLLHLLPDPGLDLEARLPWPWETLNRMIVASTSPHLAGHLKNSAALWGNPATAQEALERMVAVFATLVSRLEVPALMENTGYRTDMPGLLSCASDPWLIRALCERANLGLLLDLSHARVAAWYRGEDLLDYLAAFPWERVRELHVNGTVVEPCPEFFGYAPSQRRTGPGPHLYDAHEEMQPRDYELLAWALERCSPQIVTLEYGGTGRYFERQTDPAALRRQLERLSPLCRR